MYNAALNMQTSSSSDSYKIRPPCCVAVLMYVLVVVRSYVCGARATCSLCRRASGSFPRDYIHTYQQCRGAVAAVSHHIVVPTTQNRPYHIIENFQTLYLPVHKLGKQTPHMRTAHMYAIITIKGKHT